MKFDKKMLYYYGFLFGLGILIGYGITDICYRVYCAMRWLFMRPTRTDVDGCFKKFSKGVKNIMKKDLNMYINDITGRFNNIYGNKSKFKFLINLNKEEYADYLMSQIIPRKELDVVDKWTEYDIKIINSYLYKDLTADECFDLLVKSVNLPSKEELDLIFDKYGIEILKINKELIFKNLD